ncbi:MAG: GNAT family N-acetyltransferase [Acholeplasma sp.]|nr:GNAT family N-acetyltransferase [Acholeplasma sp.]
MLSIDLVTNDEKRTIKDMHERIFPNVYLTSDNLLENDKDKYVYVLHDEEKPISYGLIKLMKGQAFLEIFAIDEPYRGRGLAKPFITSIIHEAFKHQDIKKIFLVVDDNNEIAYQLYQKIGFRIQNQNVSYHIHHHV